MTDVLNRTEGLTANGVNLESLCRDIAWAVNFELIDGEREFGPDAVKVGVREVHSGGVVYGFLVNLGLPNQVGYMAVSEIVGDDQWHQVGGRIVADETGCLDDALDAAGRDVIADSLRRGHLANADR